jgi:hypothetical protein
LQPRAAIIIVRSSSWPDVATLGQHGFRTGDFQTARFAFQRRVDADGADSERWINLALACRQVAVGTATPRRRRAPRPGPTSGHADLPARSTGRAEADLRACDRDAARDLILLGLDSPAMASILAMGAVGSCASAWI